MNLEETLKAIDSCTRSHAAERIDYTVSLNSDGNWTIRFEGRLDSWRIAELIAALDAASADKVVFSSVALGDLRDIVLRSQERCASVSESKTTIPAIEVINRRIESLPINKAELARMAGIDGELLRRSLAGDRKLVADELVNICVVLGISMSDFVVGESEAA